MFLFNPPVIKCADSLIFLEVMLKLSFNQVKEIKHCGLFKQIKLANFDNFAHTQPHVNKDSPQVKREGHKYETFLSVSLI